MLSCLGTIALSPLQTLFSKSYTEKKGESIAVNHISNYLKFVI